MKRYTFGKQHDVLAIKNETRWGILTRENIPLNGRDDGKRYINKMPDFWFGQKDYNHKEVETKQGYKDLI